MAFFVLAFPGVAIAANQKVDVKIVKYPELGDMVRQLKGKVIVVDFWANW